MTTLSIICTRNFDKENKNNKHLELRSIHSVPLAVGPSDSINQKASFRLEG